MRHRKCAGEALNECFVVGIVRCFGQQGKFAGLLCSNFSKRQTGIKIVKPQVVAVLPVLPLQIQQLGSCKACLDIRVVGCGNAADHGNACHHIGAQLADQAQFTGRNIIGQIEGDGVTQPLGC